MAFGTDDLDLTARANLRAAFDLWPAGRPLPRDVDAVARAALELALGDVLGPRATTVHLVRFAEDDVSVWLADAIEPVSLDDFVRAVAGFALPPAYAVAALLPMRAGGAAAPPGAPVHGVVLRAACGDALIELVGHVERPGEVARWSARHGRAHDDRGRWIGVPPTVEVSLPMLGGDA